MTFLRRRPGRWLPALILWLAAIPALAGSGKAKLDAFLGNIQSLQARFEQSLHDSSQGVTRELRGTFYLQRPGKFRWEYAEPKDQIVLADGRTVWLVEGDLRQAYHKAQSEALKGTPALLLAEKLRLEDHFEVSDEGAAQGLDWVGLTPRDPDSQFVQVLLGFAGNDLSRMDLADKFGQVTRFSFSDLRRNPTLDPKLFVYTPPPGTQLFEH
jgi:outer membrane lipoprotein carrier protein